MLLGSAAKRNAVLAAAVPVVAAILAINDFHASAPQFGLTAEWREGSEGAELAVKLKGPDDATEITSATVRLDAAASDLGPVVARFSNGSTLATIGDADGSQTVITVYAGRDSTGATKAFDWRPGATLWLVPTIPVQTEAGVPGVACLTVTPRIGEGDSCSKRDARMRDISLAGFAGVVLAVCAFFGTLRLSKVDAATSAEINGSVVFDRVEAKLPAPDSPMGGATRVVLRECELAWHAQEGMTFAFDRAIGKLPGDLGVRAVIRVTSAFEAVLKELSSDVDKAAGDADEGRRILSEFRWLLGLPESPPPKRRDKDKTG